MLTETETENVNSMTILVIEQMKVKPNAASYPVIIIQDNINAEDREH